MPDAGALVQDDAVGGFQLLDHGAGAVARGLDDVDPFFDYHAGVGAVVWGNESGEEGQVHAEGVLGHGAAAADLFSQVFGGGLGQGG